MRIVDLFCGAGGAARGYENAGIEVRAGIDLVDQPRFPGRFYQGDALEALRLWRRGRKWHGLSLDDFDAFHASPPCQAYTSASPNGKYYPNLVPEVKRLLQVIGKPWVVENVPGARLRNPILLCGTMFDLRVIRHRHFETWPRITSDPPDHLAPYDHPFICDRKENLEPGVSYITVAGAGVGDREEAGDAMGIDWMTRKELNQAVPPAYAEWVGLNWDV